MIAVVSERISTYEHALRLWCRRVGVKGLAVAQAPGALECLYALCGCHLVTSKRFFGSFLVFVFFSFWIGTCLVYAFGVRCVF